MYGQHRRLIIFGLFLLLVSIILLAIIFTRKGQIDSDKTTYSAAQIAADRETAKVYIKDSNQYRSSINQETRPRIERMLYDYASYIGGNNLYTGVIRENSYKISGSPSGDFNLEMLVDIIPISITYKVSVQKNTNTNDRQAFLITCAPKSEQKSNSFTCIDETGR